MKELTKIGVENILDRIERHMIALPTEPMTAKELEMWLKGYSQCQFTIMQLISEMTEGQRC